MEKQILVAEEVGELLRVDKQRVYEITRRGLLPHIKIADRQYRYDRAAILKWIENGGNRKENEQNSTN
jgi:excisionase family DNA binding protein